MTGPSRPACSGPRPRPTSTWSTPRARPFRVAKSEIEGRKVGEVSLMPAGVVDSLSPVEFSDLIAYLSGLKATR